MTSLTLARAPARLRLHRRSAVAFAIAIPVLLAGVYAGTNAWSSLAQRDLQARWDRARAAGTMTPAALSLREFAEGEPVARLAIPAIALDLVVVQGGDGRRAPAHVPASVPPGLPGIATIIGGRFGFGNFFLHLGRLAPGDRIGVQTLGGEVLFVVRSVDVVAGAVDPGTDAAVPTLVLVAPARTFGGDRVVVRAEAAAQENGTG